MVPFLAAGRAGDLSLLLNLRHTVRESAMKLSCARKELYEGLQTVARAVSGRSSLPILSNVLLEPGPEGVKLAATDLELGLECRVPATVKEEGPITLPAKT